MRAKKSSYQIVLKFDYAGQTYEREQLFIVAYEQNLRADCDLDLYTGDMVLTLDASPCYDNNNLVTP